MKIKRHSIISSIMNVADAITHNDIDDSPTTIRTMLNDSLDYWEKEGYQVHHGYNQELAFKRVKSRIAKNMKRDERN